MSYRAKVDLIKANEEIAKLRAINAELLAALKAVEFDSRRKCVACMGWMVEPYGETRNKHTLDCPVAAAIAKAEQVQS